ncbi:MAG TPA: endonuclease/exonuclease/phosphatase family protein [Pirellulaceae bacterium]|nr:endonuclease/exonuclease/phosphatase family protein [Pirellulaceae bacterium]
MMNHLLMWIATAWLASALGMPDAHQSDDARIRVMSYNIRYGTANDGINHWNRRRGFLIATIQAFDPDLLGTQETLKIQRDELSAALPEYEVIGVGRDDGDERGEMMALYFRRQRFERLDAGHFWLSETPEVVGSKSWDSSLPRMVTWVKLKDRRQPNAPDILFLNTHFDHQGETARWESAKLLRQMAARLGADCRCIVVGDFNAGVGSEPYQELFERASSPDSVWTDTYRAIHPTRGEHEGTFSGFNAEQTRGARIDWIGVSRHWRIHEAGIDRTSRDGRTPSDHFPIFAILE